MNVHPFSGRTERPRASIGLAGSRSSMTETPRSSSPSLTSSNTWQVSIPASGGMQFFRLWR